MDIVYKVSIIENLIERLENFQEYEVDSLIIDNFENFDDIFDKLAINYNYFKLLIKEAHFKKIKILINLKIEYDLNEIQNIKKLFDHIKLWLSLDIDGFSLNLDEIKIEDKKDFLEKFKYFLLEKYGLNKILVINMNFSKSKDIVNYFDSSDYIINKKINNINKLDINKIVNNIEGWQILNKKYGHTPIFEYNLNNIDEKYQVLLKSMLFYLNGAKIIDDSYIENEKSGWYKTLMKFSKVLKGQTMFSDLNLDNKKDDNKILWINRYSEILEKYFYMAINFGNETFNMPDGFIILLRSSDSNDHILEGYEIVVGCNEDGE